MDFFGSLFGFTPSVADQYAACQQQFYLASLPRRTIPAGVDWERTGPRQWLVTVRPEPEAVIDWTLCQQASSATLAALNMGAQQLNSSALGYSGLAQWNADL